MLSHSPYLDFFLRGVLTTTKPITVIFVILFGYIFLKKEAFGRAFCIFAFAIILNPFLKSLFQVPLPPTLGSAGWAFPSGHMLTATIFWAWLAWEYKSKNLWIFVVLLLTGIGIGLVYFGYHYPSDIAGALFFALLTLYLYHLLLKLPIFRVSPPLIGFALALISLLLICGIFSITQPKAISIRNAIGLALGALLGFSVGWLIDTKFLSRDTLIPVKIKFCIFLLSIVGLVVIDSIFHFIPTKAGIIKTFHYFFHYFILALWLTSTQVITMKFLQNNRYLKKFTKQ
jgi:PAP2 superfamily protein